MPLKLLEKLVIRFVYCIMCITLLSCNTNYQGDYRDIKIFYNTPVWELIKAIDKDDLSKVESFCKEHPDLINFQDSIFGITPLIRAVGTNKYNSTKILLENGANPNIPTKELGTSIFIACWYNWNNYNELLSGDYLTLLLKYNANPNIELSYLEKKDIINITEPETTPLMFVASYALGASKLQILLENGADINHINSNGQNAATKALLYGNLFEAHYLICTNKSQVPISFYTRKVGESYFSENKNIKDTSRLLLLMLYDLNSREYRLKMEIVKELKKQGIDYDEAKKNIPDRIIKTIQQRYPNTWQEYIEKY